ncbi:Fatty acid oxidation complex subunit alpha [Pseudomonas fluorescens]|uniref:Fatty acid oxidation complex subunit alpha n=1 Tax=Pseudomonas fluorescens TaxID=294 RepID=A0A5E6U389_PSEFL|nr:enoyl-CoA hydratase/isomerase family protein [Pseudomonas fluorescens]VVM99590.1 Fatty acid oxidation complex subunit alpha [Pseudomonas fluorescens]VVP32028.1 Fatty acid oxidation complex subunit alpha [Pseudomonas fluorescens]
MTAVVQMTREGGVALIRVDNPPVNALGHAVRAGLLNAFIAAEQDERVELIMLYCEGKTFIAGADIREFGQPAQAPILQELTLAIENGNKPSLAVLHGSVLGGGLEIALGCHYRIAHSATRLGLPETRLGLLPGGGGTQRLPRLVGVETALDMILTGEPIEADQALGLGLVDALFDDEPLAAGLQYARQLLANRAPVRRVGQIEMSTTSARDSASIAARRSEICRTQPDSFSAPRCLAAVDAATRMPLIDGLQHERALFLECMASPQRAALIEDFFARRQAAKNRQS